MPGGDRPAHPSLGEATRVWLRVALLSFGGPAGQIAVMHRALVEERRWLGDDRFLHALNFCMLLPGPEAQQLATYVGWLLHGARGGLVAGLLFILPGLVSILALSWLYVHFGEVGIVAAAFFGLKAAVLAIVLQAVARIGRRTLRSAPMAAVAAAAFVAIFAFGIPFPAIVLAAGAAGFAAAGIAVTGPPPRPSVAHLADAEALLGAEAGAAPAAARRSALLAGVIALVLWVTPVAMLLLLAGPGNVFTQIATFFSRMALVSFGGAYAALAYVAQQAVETHGWLAPGEMLDGLGMAETTPGPLIMTLQFVGFLAAYREAGWASPLLAGTLGGLLATWVTFAPCFAWIFLGAPFVERLRGNRALSAALAAVSAAVVGVILNVALWFALHVLFREVVPISAWPLSIDLPRPASIDWAAAALSTLALVAVFRLGLGMAPVLVGAATLGIALWATGLA